MEVMRTFLIIILISFSTNSHSQENRFTYYSLSSGEIDIYQKNSTEGSLYIAMIAELDSIEFCQKSDRYICLYSENISIAVPRNLADLINKSDLCSKPEWNFNKFNFKVVAYEDHRAHTCDEKIPNKREIVGKTFEAFKIKKSNNKNNKTSVFLWSINRGLVAFTGSGGDEYWLKSPCGFGSSSICYQ